MIVYLRRRPLSFLLVVHANIPLRVPPRNAIRQSIAASAPLLPSKATEKAGGLLLLRLQCCSVAAAIVSHERFRTITMTIAARAPLLPAKATEGAGALLLLHKCRTVPRATIGAA